MSQLDTARTATTNGWSTCAVGNGHRPTPADAGRAFWRELLRAGGHTAIPRWTLAPVPGVAEHREVLPAGLVAALEQLAAESALELGTLVLAAHLRVLAALSGEDDVVTGLVVTPSGPALPLRSAADGASWRVLLERALRAEAELVAHRAFPVAELRAELGCSGPAFETVLDATGVGGQLTGPDLDSVVLRADLLHASQRPVLRLRYRTEILDTAAAARIAGYHLTALEQLATDPDAEPTRQSVLSAEEFAFQLDGLAGPRRERPDRRFHELFEERAAARPDAVAAVHGGTALTYAELNARANRLGRALRARGIGAEDVVGVVTERNLEWLTAVLAIFKAGGVYLPIEPHFPADRIAATLSRAQARLVLTEPESTGTLNAALAGLTEIRVLFIADALAEEHADSDLGLPVGPGRLAYIYFTSGSTGAPKGAMCEHAGMLNHLYAKIEDLGIDEGTVVAQTAPQCFDISLWQLISALLVGGRTLIVPQETIMDVERFVDTLVEGRVAVAQLVPSYLEVVLTYLEQHPRELPDLRAVSATGEALKKELTERWFAAKPGVALVNAYGLTETSDDTNHEVMRSVPERERVPLGPAVANVSAYVVDSHLNPVPLGAPGEIVFSGVCVGRGYINDPERTRAAFMTDPHRPGRRLYRAGDFGRWLPEGKLEFLGRRDSQVKIRGFRIEIGEIENTLLRVPGVRDGAVVVAGSGETAQLVAFYSADEQLGVELLREQLGASLPSYMVPSAFHHRERLPLTGNGKIDKKVLAALAGELDVVTGEAADGPRTPTERRVAAVWAKLLGMPVEQIGRRDSFFDLGGSSLSAVKLAIALKRAVSLRDITRHPVLADLAALLDGAAQRGAGLLQPLAEPDGAAAATLVCFPYAGGNAVNFQPMARELGEAGFAVYAVELPGHDLAARGEAFAALPRIVEQAVAEIVGRAPARLLLWGHSAGAAFALATAAALQQRGVPVERVFLGAQLPRDAATRRAAAAELAERSDADIVAGLAADGGYTELSELDSPRAHHVAAAYRHDCITTNRAIADALDNPPPVRLATPVSVVLADDDPSTVAGLSESGAGSYRGWEALAEQVELCRLTGGGHYFLRTRAAEAAAAVREAVHAVSSS